MNKEAYKEGYMAKEAALTGIGRIGRVGKNIGRGAQRFVKKNPTLSAFGTAVGSGSFVGDQIAQSAQPAAAKPQRSLWDIIRQFLK